MFRPERMRLVAILALEPQVELLTAAVARAGILHLVNAPGIPEFAGTRQRARGHDLLARASALEARTKDVGRRLGAIRARRPKVSLSLGAEGFLDHVEKELVQIERALDDAEKKISAARADEVKYEEISALMGLIADGESTVEDLKGGVFDRVFLGFVSLEELGELRGDLDALPCAYTSGWAGKVRRCVCVATTARHADRVQQVLSSSGFVPASIPPDLSGRIPEAHEDIELRVWEARENEAEERAVLKDFADRRGNDIAQWIVELAALRCIEEASLQFATTGTVEVIAGWVPENSVKMLKRLVDNVGGGKAIVRDIPEADAGEDGPPPTSLRNPPFVRAFENLVSLYGTPPYDGIDPTPFMALSFTIMFGVMFGDVGHGLVLAAIGLALWLFFRGFSASGRDLGEVIGFCGVSAAIFGVLFGSVFGVETAIVPQLFLYHPFQDTDTTLLLGLGMGVVMLSMGIIFNVAQQLFRRRWRDALIGEWGLASLLFYWGLMGVLVYAAVTPDAPRGRLLLILVVVVVPPVLATALRGPIGQIVSRIRGPVGQAHAHHHHEEDEDVMTTVIGTLVAVLETVTATFSHIRVAAFALNHAALCMAVFEMAKVLEQAGASGTLTTSTIVIGNVVVIALEGLIVFIQCMRLHFYEFFSKFFAHMGVPYAPLRIE
jgi:V/A-type H+-transporting ATPase subunit I